MVKEMSFECVEDMDNEGILYLKKLDKQQRLATC